MITTPPTIVMARWLLALTSLIVMPLMGGCRANKAKGPKAPTAAASQQSQIIFSHAKHIEEEVDCTDCHDAIDKATALGKRHSPTMETCGDCHEVKDKTKCKMCHRDPKRPQKLPRRPSTARLRFSHQAHITRGKGKKENPCALCHTGAMLATSLDQVKRPTMRGDCFSACHEKHLTDYRALRCTKCHQSLSAYPIRFVSAFNHEGNFLKEHNRWGASQQDLCASCHRQKFCADCHSRRAGVRPSLKFAERSSRRFIHRGDWQSRHPIAARAQPMTCTKCHSARSCESCHSSRGLSAATQPKSARKSPHAAGWLDPSSPNSHGLEARRHITRCAGCHDQGKRSNCVRCHKSAQAGGLGIMPHPPGWKRSGKTDKKVCLFCHVR